MARQILVFSLVLMFGVLAGIGLMVSTEKNIESKPESPFTSFNREYTSTTGQLIAILSKDNTVAGVDKAHQVLKQRKLALQTQLDHLRTLSPSEFSKDLEEFMKNNTANRERLSTFLNGNKDLGKSVKTNPVLKAKLKDLLSTYASIIN